MGRGLVHADKRAVKPRLSCLRPTECLEGFESSITAWRMSWINSSSEEEAGFIANLLVEQVTCARLLWYKAMPHVPMLEENGMLCTSTAASPTLRACAMVQWRQLRANNYLTYRPIYANLAYRKHTITNEPGISSDSTTLKHVVSVLGLGNLVLSAEEAMSILLHSSPGFPDRRFLSVTFPTKTPGQFGDICNRAGSVLICFHERLKP
ncbi:hypothetical protein DV515_00000705 [Chloebia gouldiae]|uniref:Uncharacterized protein n=1 Tax=Chloebia gouldiae TaxID=44316 RepID=A0A3L8SYS8_CHLGU|nr:hypothetical protein DV515_00000705 [Chloebia gouldiae]